MNLKIMATLFYLFCFFCYDGLFNSWNLLQLYNNSKKNNNTFDTMPLLNLCVLTVFK